MDSILIRCKNCGNEFCGKYCNVCGEKVYTEKERSAFHFLEEGFHFLTHFEGTFFTTIRTLFFKPGQISVDYAFGVRKKYFRLLSLFLLLVVVYLLFPAFEGLNMKLKFHEQHPMYGGYATEKVKAIMLQKNWSAAEAANVFQNISEKTSKILLLLIIPLTALACWAVTFKKRRYVFDQMVFATEVNCFYLLWGFLLLPLIVLGFGFIFKTIFDRYFPFNDSISAIVVSIPLVVFVGIAGRRFYKLKNWQLVLFALYFFVAHTFVIQFVYKFVLFVAVIKQIH